MPITISGSGTMGTMASGGITGGATITSGTAVASTSGTSIDFTSIPSWVKRITVMFVGVSTSGSSSVQIQIGSGTFTTSGYLGAVTSGSTTNMSSGFLTSNGGIGADIRHGQATIVLATTNTYVMTYTGAYSNSATTVGAGASVVIGGTLDRVRITTVNGTDTFDAGTINILYE